MGPRVPTLIPDSLSLLRTREFSMTPGVTREPWRVVGEFGQESDSQAGEVRRVASTSLPYIERNGRDYVREIHNKRRAWAGNLAIRLLCWLPGLFLSNDFTVPGAATKQGRRQEPCTNNQITGPISQPEDLRVPAAVLLRYAIRKDETAKPFLGPMTSSGLPRLAYVRAALFLPNFCLAPLMTSILAASSSMPSARHGRRAWPQESLYLFQSLSIALAISLAAERNQFDSLRRRSFKILATWRLLPR